MLQDEQTPPALSVVVASQNARSTVLECLTALESQRDAGQPEVIVVDNSTDGTAEIIRSQFPHLKLIRLPDTALIPELWEAGIRLSSGEIIATTTTHFLPQQNWVAQIQRAHRSPAVGIGGTIENDRNADLTGWAVYFCRYSPYMLPAAVGPVADIAADNASYKRWALERCRPARANGFWEARVHAEFRRLGLTLLLDPSIVVMHKKSFSLTGFVKQRFWHGRQFGRARATSSTSAGRLLYILLAPGIPLLLLARITRRVVAKERLLGKFLLSLPILVVFILSWSLGELSGYLLIQSKGR